MHFRTYTRRFSFINLSTCRLPALLLVLAVFFLGTSGIPAAGQDVLDLIREGRDAATEQDAQSTQATPAGQYPVIKIKPGDNLYDLANKYGTTVEALMKANRLRDDFLYPGDSLIIPVKQAERSGDYSTHRIRYGDNLYDLANRYGTTVEALMKANRMKDDFLYPGETLIIPGKQTGQTGDQTEKTVISVEDGDSLYYLAEKYGTTVEAIKRANNLRDSYIYPGDRLVIPGRRPVEQPPADIPDESKDIPDDVVIHIPDVTDDKPNDSPFSTSYDLDNPAVARYPAIAGALEREQKMDLQDGSRSYFLPAENRDDPRGTVVLLHGWSAGTWQYENMAKDLQNKGYNVYVPRLPGHGFRNADGTDNPNYIPRSGQEHLYTEFADRVYHEASSTGAPVHVVGLSGGGAVALDIAGRYPDIKGAVAYDPFLNSGDWKARTLLGTAGVLDRFSFGQASRLLSNIPVVFDGPKRDHEEWGRPGHFNFNAEQMFALSSYGRQAANNAAKSDVPIQVITSDSEKGLVDRGLIGTAFWGGKGEQRNGWYNFAEEENVPHAMVHEREIPDEDARGRVRDLTYDFIEDGMVHNRLPGDTMKWRPLPVGTEDLEGQTRAGKKLYQYYSQKDNYKQVGDDMLETFGVLKARCTAFMSTALRNAGFDVPADGYDERVESISMVTRSLSNHLEHKLGFERVPDFKDLKPGDVVFTTDDEDWPGYPAHTFMFQGWYNKERGLAYAIDNQGFTHVRNLKAHSNYDYSYFGYALRPTDEQQ